MSLQAADIFDAWWVILFSIMVLPLIAIYIFHVRIRRQYLLKHEEKAGYWKVFVALITALTVIYGGAMLFGKYIYEKEGQIRASIESGRTIQILDGMLKGFMALGVVDSQYRTMNSACPEVIRMATLLFKQESRSIGTSGERAVSEFNRIYFGDLLPDATESVINAVTELRQFLITERSEPLNEKSAQKLIDNFRDVCERERISIGYKINQMKNEMSQRIIEWIDKIGESGKVTSEIVDGELIIRHGIYVEQPQD